MNQPIVVEIDRTKRRAIVLAALTGYVPPFLRDEPAQKMKVTDNEIKDFLLSMPASETIRISTGKLGATFRANSQAALDRLAALTHGPTWKNTKATGNSRITTSLIKFEDNEVLGGNQRKKKRK